MVIDLGDCTIIKLERGTKADIILGGVTYEVRPNSIQTVQLHSFEAVRAAIDALDGEKPVPRIEKYTDGQERYLLFQSDAKAGCPNPSAIYTAEYQALSELAGKPLPVWKGKKGEWKKLGKTYDEQADDVPVTVWRYTLKGEQK